jgi:hypothetical protein
MYVSIKHISSYLLACAGDAPVAAGADNHLLPGLGLHFQITVC